MNSQYIEYVKDNNKYIIVLDCEQVLMAGRFA